METYLVTCNAGLEDIVKAELRDYNPKAQVKKFFDFHGHIEITNASIDDLFKLRSIDQIVEIKGTFKFDKTLDQLIEKVKEIPVDELETAQSFRVSTRRYGIHSFSSHEVQAVAGEVLQKKYSQTVSLKEYDINVKLDIIGKFAYIGIRRTPEKYYKRFEVAEYHRAGIKTSVAYALLRLADIQKGEIVLDPFCGSGTIPMEAAENFGENARYIGGDLYEDVIESAKENARLNNMDQLIDYRQLNVFQLEEYIKEPIDKIVTNPPYGVKSATKSNMRNLLRAFVIKSAHVLKEEGKLVVLMQRADMFRQTVLRTKLFKITEERVIESGSLYPHLFVLGKIDEPDSL